MADHQHVERIKLRDFRCYAGAQVAFEPGVNLMLGANAAGKTSLLEAVCVMLRLNSPRASRLATLVRHGAHGLVVDGRYGGHHLQLYYSSTRRKLALDSIERKSASEFLALGRAVYFANDDIRLVRDGDAGRRRLLDFLGAQALPGYRATARRYEKALQSRNRLLKSAASPARDELQAFSGELVRHGEELTRLRRRLVGMLRPHARNAHQEIAAGGGVLEIGYDAGAGDDLAARLDQLGPEERRLRQTLAGPHRDAIPLTLDGMPAAEFASEGQQRTIALALRMAEGGILREDAGHGRPVYLIDDVFGELDPSRRHALLAALPSDCQWLVTCTSSGWMDDAFTPAASYQVGAGAVRRVG